VSTADPGVHSTSKPPVDEEPRGLHRHIEAQVDRTPDAVAVVCGDESLTYAELDRRANRVAHHLRSLGVTADETVGVLMERSLELVVALLGVLKAGGAYVPIDPAYPRERITALVRDSGARAVLTQERFADRAAAGDAVVVALDGAGASRLEASSTRPAPVLAPDNLAYVIYTSGSTGQPKGAMNTHGAIVNRLVWMQRQYGLTASDRVLQKTPFTFDVSVWEFFWPLMAGARLVVARPGGHQEGDYLVRLIAHEGITTVHFVPSMLQRFLEEPGVGACRSLVRVICSGEALSFDLQERFFTRLGAELHNLYGPTEAAVDVTYWACRRDGERGPVPIGHAIDNVRMHVLDHAFEPAPAGVAGELYIAGVGLARGYLGRPDLTAERFIPDPTSGARGARLYRTGDRARQRPDGALEYLGRTDHQIKLRGFRIELGEIEAVLGAHPGLREAVVNVAGEDDERRLVAHFVPTADASVWAADLRAYLLERVPDYMVPAEFITMERLPLTSSGKVDRRALPTASPVEGEAAAPFVAPRTPVEASLAAIWAEVLKRPAVGIHDNFFELGGHSLLMTRVVSRIRDSFQVELTMRAFFQSPTVALLAAAVMQAQAERSETRPMHELLDEIEALSDDELKEMLGRS
jgi:amino acid adenylation domain-containing protein